MARTCTTGADRTARIGAVGEVTGTPWRVWVEFPRETVVAPARNFLRRIIFVAAVLVWCAVILVALFAWQVTTPLTALTHAAEAIAKGDYTQTGRQHAAATRSAG